MKTKHLVIVGIIEVVDALKDPAERLGIVVTAFSNGEQAKDAIPNIEGPDVFVMNVLFPFGHAYELAPMIREHHPRAKIWLMSARAEDMREEIEQDPNFDRMILWPGPVDQLLADVLRESIKS
jgi:CheY-like chemotaxis protein